MRAFLFTDLESSTRLWEEHPEAMRPALARHDAILREAVEGAGGSVVKTTGDGLMAVFEATADSIAAGLAAQQALAAEPWETTEPLRVRIGVHAGEAEARAGDFYGTAVNRAARIMAAGHGGQLLLSGLVADLAAGSLPAGTALRDLGTHRLKDLTQPEHLYQLVVDGLPADFPPLTTLDARPNNLPIQDTEFFGRDAEMTAVLELFADPTVRLVTLTGPGGTGKTRLSLQLAAERLDEFLDGVFFIDLSPERDADAAFESVVRELRLSAAGKESPLEVLEAELRHRKLLLVLDNFEQVTEAAVDVADLLQRCPELEVIVTSREALRVRAERVFQVPPLSIPGSATDPGAAESEAVRLFVERARSSDPRFELTDANAAAAAEICIRLDGLPLAIELAAARLRVFSPSDLLDRLRRHIDVIGGGGRDLPERQRTLTQTIEWSYDLLTPHECSLYELFSVFSTADLDAVEAVTAACDPEIDALDTLASLIDKSLVRSIDEGGSRRFSMLATIKEHSSAKLAAQPEAAELVARAHADYFTTYAHNLRANLQGSHLEQTLEELGVEIGNLRTAWRYWVERADLEQLYLLLDALWTLHDARGWYHSAIELANDMLGVLATAEPSEERAAEELTLRTSLARALMAVRGYGPEVEEAFRSALALTESAGGAARRFPVLRALGSYYMNIADFAQGAEIGRQLLDLADDENDDAIRLEGEFLTGVCTASLGEVDTGLSHLDRAISLYDPASSATSRLRLGPYPAVSARMAAALFRWHAGALDTAVAGATSALDLARELDHPFSIAWALYHSGFFALARQDFIEAQARAEELATVAESHGFAIWSALSTVLRGVALVGQGRIEEGLAMTETGIDLYSGLTAPPVFWPLILTLRAVAHVAAGKVEEGLALIEAAMPGDDEVPTFPDLYVTHGDVLRASGDLDGAEAVYRLTATMAGSMGVHLVELNATARLVDLLRSQGRSPDGTEELRAAYESFTEGFEMPDLVAARALLDAAP